MAERPTSADFPTKWVAKQVLITDTSQTAVQSYLEGTGLFGTKLAENEEDNDADERSTPEERSS